MNEFLKEFVGFAGGVPRCVDEDRRSAGGRVHARRDRQRHHQGHPGELRADDRLRRRQVAAVLLQVLS